MDIKLPVSAMLIKSDTKINKEIALISETASYKNVTAETKATKNLN